MIALSCVTPTSSRKKIVCLAADFPSTIYLYRAQEPLGFELSMVPAESDLTVRAERILEAIDARTAVVALSHVLFKTSTIVDPAPIVARAHEVGAVVSNGCAAVPAMRSSTRALICAAGCGLASPGGSHTKRRSRSTPAHSIPGTMRWR
jgi:selenocysteine lyase/cysteine desulfurase